MLRLRGTLAAAGLSLGWMAAAVMAAPPVLDRVPDNAMIVVAIPSADAVQKNIQSLVTAAELPIPAVPKIEDLLAMGGVTQGLDTGKSAALVVFAPDKDKAAAKKAAAKVKADAAKKDASDKKDMDDKDADIDGDDDAAAPGDEQIVILLPITKYEDLLANFNAKPGAAGSIDQISMPDGNDGFVKDVGNGYAAMSPNKDLLTRFDAKSGAAALKGKLGKAGDALADASDLVTIVNMDVVRPMWPEIKKEMEEKIKEEAANLPMGEDAPNPMQNPAVSWLADMVMRDSKAMVGGLKTGNTGVNLDFAVNFSEGTQMSKMFSGTGKAGALLGKLPGASYLLAGALDLSNAELKTFLKDFAAKGADVTKALGMEASTKRLDATDGASAVVGVPAGGIFGGLLTSTVSYTATKDAAAYIAMQKDEMGTLNGKEKEGFSMETTYKDASTKVDGIDVDEYSVKFKVDPNSEAGEMAPQALNAIFGPSGGPAGYIAKTDGGVYQTFGKNSQLLSSAMKAGKGEGSLSADQMMTQVGSALPPNRIAEAYVGTKGLLDLIVPAAAMFTGVQIPPETIPESLPPVGMGISGRDGAAHFSVFIPAPVIKTATKIATTVQKQMEDGFGEGEGGDNPAPEKDGKGGTGQPRF